MRVELLWWEGCPSHPETLADLSGVLREEGVDGRGASWSRSRATSRPARERFPGSPTIRIDGEDAFPRPEGEPFSLTCRVYRLRDGRVSPTPDPEDLRERDEEDRCRSAMRHPASSLPDTDGAASTAPTGVTVVVFTCNHCPYALGLARPPARRWRATTTPVTLPRR